MNPKVLALANAIAKAEGFYSTGSIPQRANNPGDLEVGDIGLGMIGNKTIFETVEAGWGALQRQCALMLAGQSHVYEPSMTFLTVAHKYTGGDNPIAWANIVASDLRMNIQDTLADYMEDDAT